jgi:hypothetical protein
MDLRYPFLAMANLVAGGFLVAAVYGFSESTAVSLGFAISIAVAVIGLAMLASGFRKPGPTILGGLTALVAGWTIVATSVFPDPTARWLVLASGLAHVGLSLAGLIRHEISTERVVHHLEVTAERQPTAVG